MKRMALITTIIAALCALGAAPVMASGNHWCRQGDPRVLASAHTSCPFAESIEVAYVTRSRPYLARYWRGWVRSPVTRRNYLITCRRPGSWVTCTGINGIWVRFTADV